MTDQSGHEHGTRWGDRVTVRQPVTIQWDDRDREGMIHHLSVSGCFVQTGFPYPVGTTLHLSFGLGPDQSAFVTDGKVVMRNLGGIGVRFLYLHADDPAVLKRWIDTHRHSPHADTAFPDAA